MKHLHLDIDRVVVEGLSKSGQRRFARALEAQLQQLAESGITDAFTSNLRKRIDTLNAGQLHPRATPEQAAAQVARSIRQSVFPQSAINAPSAPSKTGVREARRHV